MRNYKLFRCLNCGHTEETDIEDISLYGMMLCPQCHEVMILVEHFEQEDNSIAEQVEMNEVTKIYRRISERKETPDIKIIKYKIEHYGNKEIWRVIENIENVYLRIAERRLFFKAGGQVPKGKGIKL